MQTFEDELLRAIRERPTGEPVLAAFGRLVLQPRGILAAADPGAAEDLAGISRVIAGSPALLAREAQILARYTDTLANLIAGETGADHTDPRPWTMANALIGVHRFLLAHLRRQIVAGHTDLPDLAREVRTHGETALALFANGLGDYAPKPPDPSPHETHS